MTDSHVMPADTNTILIQAIADLQQSQKEISDKVNSTLSSIVSVVENLKLQIDSQNSPKHKRTVSSSSLQSLSPAPAGPGTIDVNLDTIVADQPIDAPKKLQVVPVSPSSSPGPLSAVPRKLYSASPWGSRVILTTYPDPFSLSWGHPDPLIRGPIVVSRQPSTLRKRNAIGAHGGSYSIYHSLAVAMGDLPVNHRPNFAFSQPPVQVGPHPQWGDPEKIVSMDPFGHMTTQMYSDYINKGFDIRPTIAVTKAHMKLLEIENAVKKGEIRVDGQVVLNQTGEIAVTKVAVEPVWFLPGVAKRFGIDEGTLRRALFEDTGGSYPELITRNDLKVFLPPIGGLTAYIFGPADRVSDPNVRLALRIHDECNGSDVFSSDICTCRPYLMFGIEEAVKEAQNGGSGVVIYFRKEGRALGEVTKYLVYNVRKRTGDKASAYFAATEGIAGVRDMRFQALMPDILHFLGITKIDRMLSMSNMKYDAIVGQGIPIHERVEIPEHLIPKDSRVEIDAKIHSGYFSSGKALTMEDLSNIQGRTWDDIDH